MSVLIQKLFQGCDMVVNNLYFHVGWWL